MTNTPIVAIFFILLLAFSPLAHASTQSSIDYKIVNLSGFTSWFDSRNNGMLNYMVENDATYETVNDTGQPRGTQNWEESQSSFLIFPAIVLSIIAVLFFFNRD